MAFTKITNTDLNERGATTLPNQPKISATELKREFDAPAKEIVAPKFNNLIDELEATTASESLGITAPTGYTGETVQAVVNEIVLNEDQLRGSVVELGLNLEALAASVLALQESSHTHDNKALLDTYAQSESDLADAVEKKHAHENKALLDTYTQSDSDLADAVANKHAHSNKDLLDTYTQTNSDIVDAVSKKHEHSNKALLDTYTQTDSDLASAVADDHTHTNKTVLDKFSEVGGDPYYDGQPIGGGGGGSVNNAYKNVIVGNTTITARGEDSIEFIEGTNVTLTPDATNKTIEIAATGGGGSYTAGDGIDITNDEISLDLSYLTASRIGITGDDGISVLNNTISLDTEHLTASLLNLESKQGAQGGTDLSLVTTGEKYGWNAKQEAVSAGDGIKITSNVIALDTEHLTASMLNLESKAAVSSGTDLSLVTTGEKYVWDGAGYALNGKMLVDSPQDSYLHDAYSGFSDIYCRYKEVPGDPLNRVIVFPGTARIFGTVTLSTATSTILEIKSHFLGEYGGFTQKLDVYTNIYGVDPVDMQVTYTNRQGGEPSYRTITLTFAPYESAATLNIMIYLDDPKSLVVTDIG